MNFRRPAVSDRPEACPRAVAAWLRLGEAPPGRPTRAGRGWFVRQGSGAWACRHMAAGMAARCGERRGERAAGQEAASSSMKAAGGRAFAQTSGSSSSRRERGQPSCSLTMTSVAHSNGLTSCIRHIANTV